MMKKRNLLVYVLSLVVVMSILGGSYAYLRVEKESENQKVDLVTNFGINITKELEGLNLTNQVPLSDEEGVKGEARTFQITNNGTILSEYKVSLIDDSVASTLENKEVRYRLKKTKSSTGTPEVLDIKTLSDDGLIDSGTIEPTETIDYEIVCWIDYDVTEGGRSFSKKVLVEGSQPLNLDKSGANPPEMLNNMIPVYYDTSDTKWKVADATNRNETYKWYDYDDYMWANAVTVKEEGRENYLKATPGTEVKMDDITTMWVWIPRYKYTIFNGNNGTSNEQMINVKFEYGINTTGTVSCHDNILTDDDSASSEECEDKTNGSIIDGKSTYTHPAFTFGSEELVGFWFAKFEMSTDDSSCLEDEKNCNKTGMNIYIMPDKISLKGISVSNKFANLRSMELANNIHGFPQNEKATSYLDSNGNLSGNIPNDDNNYDIHMIKNMEWGAVTYLAQSKYGKMGNPLYQGDYKEIYFNGNREGTDVYIYKTGYSSKDILETYTTSGAKYDDLSIIDEKKGYAGAGASTTGTIYGIYDMNGGQFERVMANVVNKSGKMNIDMAGTWSENNLPNEKYYDKYSYNTNTTTKNSFSRAKLGDAMKEELKQFDSESSGWYNGLTVFENKWFYRGGIRTSSYSGSNASAGLTTASATSRPVLAISREIPWQNS